VRCPDVPGTYQLEVDLVQEGVAWFGDRGSPTAKRRVDVRRPPRRWRRGAADDAAAPATDDEPRMEMYGVPRDEVRAWIESAGGRVLDVFEWSEISGETSSDWQRFCFVATR
jgi:hypothetical protein